MVMIEFSDYECPFCGRHARETARQIEQAYVKKLNGPNVKKGTSKMNLAEQLMEDIKAFKQTHGCDRLIAVFPDGPTPLVETFDRNGSRISSFPRGAS